MSAVGSVAIVGASSAGLGTAEALRRKGFGGRIRLLGAETDPPYDRQRELDLELTLGDPAVRLDAPTRCLITESGRGVQADAIVIATGLSPRTLPGSAGIAGVHTLRTLADATALRSDMEVAGRTVVVVGNGVLGSEAAARARLMGAEVTLVGRRRVSMASYLGDWAADLHEEQHRRHGVQLVGGTDVERLESRNGRAVGVCLDGGRLLAADVVIIALGSVPATGWLEDSGLLIDDGVICNASCRAAPGIYAAGYVSRWYHAGLESLIRLQNRTNASAQAAIVAANILGAAEAYAPVPYFWSDQYGSNIQVHGWAAGADEAEVVEGSVAEQRFVAVLTRSGREISVIGWNMPKQTRNWRQQLGDQLRFSPSLRAA